MSCNCPWSIDHYQKSHVCQVPGTLDKGPNTLGKRFAECCTKKNLLVKLCAGKHFATLPSAEIDTRQTFSDKKNTVPPLATGTASNHNSAAAVCARPPPTPVPPRRQEVTDAPAGAAPCCRIVHPGQGRTVPCRPPGSGPRYRPVPLSRPFVQPRTAAPCARSLPSASPCAPRGDVVPLRHEAAPLKFITHFSNTPCESHH